MAAHPLHRVLHHLRRLTRTPAADALSDSQLLQRFAQTREEAAFQTLVDRHGPMVLGVCRRLLADPHDADDAFQATFLVLIRKAEALTLWGSLASWLYGVAYRTALKARSEAARRRRYERQAAVDPQTDVAESESAVPELRQVLDQELSRLPEKYRVPLVLCYLEGKTNEEAARLLGWPVGSMSRRLEKGRELLSVRLVRRGIGLSGSAIAAAMAESASSAVPVALARATLQVAGLVVAGQAATASKPALVLMEGVLRQMAYSKVKVGAGLLLMLSFLGAGAAVVMLPFAPTLPREADPDPVADPFAEPLPPGTVARLGTSRWWQKEQVDSLTFSPNGRLLMTRNCSGMPVRLWDVATGKQFPLLEGLTAIQEIVFSPDSKVLVAITEKWAGPDALRKIAQKDSTIVLWNVGTGERLRSFKIHDTDGSLAFSPDGKTLAAGRSKRQIALIDLATGRVLRELGTSDDIDRAADDVLRCGLAFSPDGKTLALIGDEPSVLGLCDVVTGKTVFHTLLNRAGDPLWDHHLYGLFQHLVVWSPDGLLLATADDGGTIYLLDASTGKERGQLHGHRGPIRALAFSADGKRLLSASADQTALVWDVRQGLRTPHP
jgi:RNA polymerase sigma factor (sigma-70 family)